MWSCLAHLHSVNVYSGSTSMQSMGKDRAAVKNYIQSFFVSTKSMNSIHSTRVRRALQGSRVGSLKPPFHIAWALFLLEKSFYCD